MIHPELTTQIPETLRFLASPEITTAKAKNNRTYTGGGGLSSARKLEIDEIVKTKVNF